MQAIGWIRGDPMQGEWVEVECPRTGRVVGFVLGDMVADADGLHTHTIMTHATPGVMHTTIFSMAARKVCDTYCNKMDDLVPDKIHGTKANHALSHCQN